MDQSGFRIVVVDLVRARSVSESQALKCTYFMNSLGWLQYVLPRQLRGSCRCVCAGIFLPEVVSPSGSAAKPLCPAGSCPCLGLAPVGRHRDGTKVK